MTAVTEGLTDLVGFSLMIGLAFALERTAPPNAGFRKAEAATGTSRCRDLTSNLTNRSAE